MARELPAETVDESEAHQTERVLDLVEAGPARAAGAAAVVAPAG